MLKQPPAVQCVPLRFPTGTPDCLRLVTHLCPAPPEKVAQGGGLRLFAAGRDTGHEAFHQQAGLIRHRKVEAEKGDDGTDPPFGLRKGQTKHGSQRQRRRNSQGGVARLTAAAATPHPRGGCSATCKDC